MATLLAFLAIPETLPIYFLLILNKILGPYLLVLISQLAYWRLLILSHATLCLLSLIQFHLLFAVSKIVQAWPSLGLELTISIAFHALPQIITWLLPPLGLRSNVRVSESAALLLLSYLKWHLPHVSTNMLAILSFYTGIFFFFIVIITWHHVTICIYKCQPCKILQGQGFFPMHSYLLQQWCLMCAKLFMYMYMYICTHTHIHIHTYTHVCWIYEWVNKLITCKSAVEFSFIEILLILAGTFDQQSACQYEGTSKIHE